MKTSDPTLLLLPLLLLLGATLTTGYPSFQDQIPNGGQVPNPCQADSLWQGVGHTNPQGGGSKNSFGADFKRLGYQWSVELCQRDSDYDGMTNGQELGDPDCTWTPGSLPTRTTSITHPSLCDPWDDPTCKLYNAWVDCDAINNNNNGGAGTGEGTDTSSSSSPPPPVSSSSSPPPVSSSSSPPPVVTRPTPPVIVSTTPRSGGGQNWETTTPGSGLSTSPTTLTITTSRIGDDSGDSNSNSNANANASPAEVVEGCNWRQFSDRNSPAFHAMFQQMYASCDAFSACRQECWELMGSMLGEPCLYGNAWEAVKGQLVGFHEGALVLAYVQSCPISCPRCQRCVP